MMEQSPLSIYFGAVIELIPQDEFMALLQQFGSKKKPSVKELNALTQQYGEDFLSAVAELAKEHTPAIHKPRKTTGIDVTPVNASDILSNISVNTPSTSNVNTWNSSAYEWFGTVTNFLLDGFGKTTEFMSVLTGTNAASYEALMAKYNLESQQELTRRAWKTGALIFVGAVVVIFIATRMFGTHR